MLIWIGIESGYPSVIPDLEEKLPNFYGWPWWHLGTCYVWPIFIKAFFSIVKFPASFFVITSLIFIWSIPQQIYKSFSLWNSCSSGSHQHFFYVLFLSLTRKTITELHRYLISITLKKMFSTVSIICLWVFPLSLVPRYCIPNDSFKILNKLHRISPTKTINCSKDL